MYNRELSSESRQRRSHEELHYVKLSSGEVETGADDKAPFACQGHVFGGYMFKNFGCGNN